MGYYRNILEEESEGVEPSQSEAFKDKLGHLEEIKWRDILAYLRGFFMIKVSILQVADCKDSHFDQLFFQESVGRYQISSPSRIILQFKFKEDSFPLNFDSLFLFFRK